MPIYGVNSLLDIREISAYESSVTGLMSPRSRISRYQEYSKSRVILLRKNEFIAGYCGTIQITRS